MYAARNRTELGPGAMARGFICLLLLVAVSWLSRAVRCASGFAAKARAAWPTNAWRLTSPKAVLVTTPACCRSTNECTP